LVDILSFNAAICLRLSACFILAILSKSQKIITHGNNQFPLIIGQSVSVVLHNAQVWLRIGCSFCSIN
jgi:hypothetical protein